ncbi:MAG TPA: DMT family transporter [Acidimicrobiia bacterium]
MARLITTSHGTNRDAFTPVDWALFGTLGLIWGSSFLLMAIGLDSFHPGLVTLLRIVAASLFLYSVPRIRNSRIDPEDRGRIILIAFTWVALPFTMFPIAQQWIASGTAGLINGTTPIFAAIVASILLRTLPGRLQRVGLIMGLAGVVLIALPSINSGTNEAIGILLALVAAASYGVSINISVPVVQKYGSLPVMSRVIWFAIPMALPYGIYGLLQSDFSVPSFVATVAVGLFGTGIAFILAGRIAASVGATRSSFIAYVLPVVALILGVVFRDETVNAMAIAGIALVLVGAFLASRKERSTAREPEPATAAG